MKFLDLMPEKKLSYNDSLHHKKKLEIQLKGEKYHRHGETTMEAGLREKKRSGQYERTFFR